MLHLRLCDVAGISAKQVKNKGKADMFIVGGIFT